MFSTSFPQSVFYLNYFYFFLLFSLFAIFCVVSRGFVSFSAFYSKYYEENISTKSAQTKKQTRFPLKNENRRRQVCFAQKKKKGSQGSLCLGEAITTNRFLLLTPNTHYFNSQSVSWFLIDFKMIPNVFKKNDG